MVYWVFTQFHPFSPIFIFFSYFLLIPLHLFLSRLISGCEEKGRAYLEEDLVPLAMLDYLGSIVRW